MTGVSVVFAGGQSRRMGQNKLLLPRHSGATDTVLTHVIRVASEVSKTVLVLTPPAQDCPFQSIIDSLQNVCWIRDDIAYEGPLQALGRAFGERDVSSDSVWTFIPGDLPGLDKRVLIMCSERLQQSTDVDAALVVREERWQPLLGCYRGHAMKKIVTRAKHGERRFMPILDTLKIEGLKQEEFLWPEWWTKPIHTPGEYDEWCEWIMRTLDNSV